MAERYDSYEPMPRSSHVSAQVGNKVLVYSGWTQDRSQQNRRRLASAVEVFDTRTELWETKQTTGDLPVPGLYYATGVSLNEDLFTYGGVDNKRQCLASLHRLDTKTYHWYKLSPQNTKEESPIAKIGGGMIACGDNLALVAGRGVPDGPTQLGSTFVKNTEQRDGSGWTNEFHIYRCMEGMGTCTH